MNKAELATHLEGLEDGSFVLRTEAEEKEFRENLVKTEVDKKIGDRIKEVHTSYDEDIYKSIGKRRAEGVSTYDFMKDEFVKLKTKADSTHLLEQQIKDLKTEMAEGSGDETLKKQLKSVESKLIEASKIHEKEKAEYEGNFNNYKIQSALDNNLAKMKLRADLPENVVKSYLDAVKTEMTSKAMFQDGELVFKDGDNGILIDMTTAKPVSADVILAEKLKDILATEGKAGLGGNKANVTPTGDIVPPDSALINNDALARFLQEELMKSKGYTKRNVRDSKEYIELFGKYMKR